MLLQTENIARLSVETKLMGTHVRGGCGREGARCRDRPWRLLSIDGQSPVGLTPPIKEASTTEAAASRSGRQVFCRGEEDGRWQHCGDEAACALPDVGGTSCCSPPLREMEMGGPLRRVLAAPFTLVYGTHAQSQKVRRKSSVTAFCTYIWQHGSMVGMASMAGTPGMAEAWPSCVAYYEDESKVSQSGLTRQSYGCERLSSLVSSLVYGCPPFS